MEYLRKNDLEKLRKAHTNETYNLELYAVYFNLAIPVFKIKHISKKYVYWEDDSKHPYPSNSAGYSLFDNESEAWKHYKKLYETQKKSIQEKYEMDMKQLTKAKKILEKCAEETPEYFL